MYLRLSIIYKSQGELCSSREMSSVPKMPGQEHSQNLLLEMLSMLNSIWCSKKEPLQNTKTS